MLQNIIRSLEDLLGAEYLAAVCGARAAMTGECKEDLLALARKKTAFYPPQMAARQEALMDAVGRSVCAPAPDAVRTMTGAPTDSYRAAQCADAAPLGGYGCFRTGEDGRLYFAAKSEHYHIPLGHSFPGYDLIETAKALGIPNATHNNTRGYVTRLLERRLIEAANGVKAGTAEYEAVLASRAPGVLNRVVNLETGSLAVEAALKMMLNRFYAMEGGEAPYAGRIPVFLVMEDNLGGIGAGYHGTTILAQTLRGLWPAFREKAAALYRVEPVRINDAAAFAEAMERWNRPPYKTAGFCHELIMMNYSAIVLQKEVLQAVYRLCRETDTAVLCDEIQSSAWYDTLFLFRKYDLTPDFVSIGKGFPGGCYPASKVLVSGAYDNLSQFGALVTNGQEELASLAYLITMEFVQANGAHLRETGARYHRQMAELAARHPKLCAGVEGDAHMTSLLFLQPEAAKAFGRRMTHDFCVDLSVQANKAGCPPAALTKLPLLVTPTMAEKLVGRMEACLLEMEG